MPWDGFEELQVGCWFANVVVNQRDGRLMVHVG